MSLDEASKAYLTGFADGQKFAGWKEEAATINERERIIKLLEADCKDGLGDHLQGCSHEVAIALIKGENKQGHNGGEHTPCCNDWGCYGCDGCDCPDCLEGENK